MPSKDLRLVDDALTALRELKAKLSVDPEHVANLEWKLECAERQQKDHEAELKHARWMASDKRFEQMVSRNTHYSRIVREVLKKLPKDHEVSVILRNFMDGACKCGLPFAQWSLDLHAKYPEQHKDIGKRTYYICKECSFCGHGENKCAISGPRRKTGKTARYIIDSDTTARKILGTIIKAVSEKDDAKLKAAVKFGKEFLAVGSEAEA